jgi:hypothetical protein
MRRGQAYAQNQAGTNERQDKRTSANKQVAGTSTNRLEPAQPSRDQVSGPSASEHTTARAQTRWYEHEQGQERGERRRARGRASERNAAASGIENNSGGYNKCGGSDSRNGSSRSGAGAGSRTAAAGQGRERERERLQQGRGGSGSIGNNGSGSGSISGYRGGTCSGSRGSMCPLPPPFFLFLFTLM